jgi:predicted MFS family arabinose efflux permease
VFSNYLNSYLKSHKIHYGWVMAGLVFLMTIMASAVSSTPQLIILPITEEYNWQISDITNAIGLMFFTLACLAPFSGALILNLGVTPVVLMALGLNIIGLGLSIISFEKWHFLITIGVFLGAASGIIGLGLTATVASRWFVKRRGLVVGFLTAAFAAGQLLFVPLMAWITTVVDWRFALLIPIMGSLISSILFLFFGKNWPSDLNLAPFGSLTIEKPPKKASQNAVLVSFQVLKSATTQPAFWILSATFFICGLSSTGIVGQHFIPFCADNNVGIVAASSYLAIMGIFNFIGTIGSGWLSDRFDNYKLLMWFYGLRALSLIYLPFSGFEFFTLLLWAMFFGLDFIATVPPTVKLTSKYFGTINGPVLFGWIFAAHQMGSAIAASSAGWSRDTVLTYMPSFVVAGLLSLLAVFLIIIFKKLDMSKMQSNAA